MILRIFTAPAYRLLLISWLCSWFTGCSKSESGSRVTPVTASLQLAVTHLMNGEPLVRRNTVYTNPSGETFIITRFRYYLSNFSLTSTSGKMVTLPPAYFLVDDSSAASKVIILDSIPTGNYNSITFLIGVDSARNMSGVQGGALAPENGLFWSWNSGYIMAQLEGTAPVINSPTQEFLFHIGGFKGPYNVLQPVTLNFPQPVAVTKDKLPQVQLLADAAKWFHTPNTISFKNVAVIMAPGPDAQKIAANYRQMFTVKSITN